MIDTFPYLRLRTEYSFRRAYGRVADILPRIQGASAAAITDYGTWGHVEWFAEAKKVGIKPILGVELALVTDATVREKQNASWVVALARNLEGLAELYRLVTRANSEGFYYVPRVSVAWVNDTSPNLVCIVSGGPHLDHLVDAENICVGISPESRVSNRRAVQSGRQCVVVCDNYYPCPDDKDVYEVIAGERGRRDRTTIMHIPSLDELRLAVPEATDDIIDRTVRLAGMFELDALPKASMVSDAWPKSLRELCLAGARKRKLKLTGEYKDRLAREVDMIESKGFTDYFMVIAEMVNRAKRTMFVGPARGSAAGSLVCYLLGITDVDPIIHKLMFERFIDVSRSDLPDIDIDFPDVKRDEVIAQLGERWGTDRVARIGTVMRYKPKSTLTDVARELNVPAWEVNDVKDTITERSSGDERAAFAVADALDETDVGKSLLERFPEMKLAGKVEGHARQCGTHAAGVLVSAQPVTTFASLDHSGSVQIDKYDVRKLDLLKIDALGLRTLSVLEDCLEQIGKKKEWLINYPLDDTEAFDIFNQERYAGIFQYEGYALQALCRQMKIHEFNDIAVITALARPGPLHCGAANEFVNRKLGKEPVVHLHPTLEDVTRETYGSVVYQEQVMFTCRRMGLFEWEDVSFIRKAISDRLGEETFNRYWAKFKEGAAKQGIPESEARAVWDKICTFGSWAFNLSHAVSYGLISYWCAVLKAHYPLQFGAACLRNAKDDDQTLRVLRELVREGFEYKPVDPEHSGLTWEVHDGKLLGGLTNIRGIGLSKARDIISRRERGLGLTPGLARALSSPVTPFDYAFEAQERYKDMFENPLAHGIVSGQLSLLETIHDAGDYVFIAKIRERKLRDMNEAHTTAKRGGRRISGRTTFLNLVLEDDTGTIIAKVDRNLYPRWGKPLVEQMKTGDYCLWKGRVRDGWRIVYIDKWRSLEDSTANQSQ
jgi:DNA polymerase III alpha subunit